MNIDKVNSNAFQVAQQMQPHPKQPHPEATEKPKVNDSRQTQKTPSPEAKILDEAKETRAEKSLEKMKGENPTGGILNTSV